MPMFGMNSALRGGGVAPPTVVILTTGTSWTPPTGVTNLKSVECWGPGGAGWLAGGGGGAYAKIVNLACTPGTAITMSIGQGGVVSVAAGPSPANDGTGTTWFKTTTTVLADYGRGGASDSSSANCIGVGGKASASVGTTKFDGGTGAYGQYGGQSEKADAAGGGGGAAGPLGGGNNGTSNYTQPSGPGVAGPGGSGNAGSGGAGGAGSTASSGSASDGGPGGSSTEGGGGGAASSYNNGQADAPGGNAGLGGAPGGGGGGAYALAVGGGNGQIRITY